MSINLIIAEKNPLLQDSLQQLFMRQGQSRIVALALDGADFLTQIQSYECDIGIIGWDLPVISGSQVLVRVARIKPNLRVIVYTGNAHYDIPRQAMLLGAAGFCSKNDSPDLLLQTVLAVAAGRMVFPFMKIIDCVDNPLDDLTKREKQLLGSLAHGLTNRQLAVKHEVSPNTVKFHLGNLYSKLGVSNRAQAIAFFLKSQNI